MTGRTRAAWATVSSTPWRRAPMLLWRRPGVFATVAAACAVLVAAVASVPLFLSSVGTASVSYQAAERCGRDTGATRTLEASPADVRDPGADPFGPLSDRLGPSNHWVRLRDPLPLRGIGGDTDATDDVVLLSRDEAVDHVDVVERVDGPGAWISDRAAAETGLGAGDVARIGPPDASVEIPVAAVYRDLSGNEVGPFWCSNASALLIEARGGELVRPPPVVLVDGRTMAEVMTALQITRAGGAWDAPLRADLTLRDVDELVDELACHGGRAPDLVWCERGQPPLFVTGYRPAGLPARNDVEFVQAYFGSSLPFVAARSRAILTSVSGGVWPVSAFAALASLGLVAASASLWFDRRRREIRLLAARGVSPAGLALKAVLEASPALVVGAAAGVVLSWAAVVRLGPSSVIEPGAVARAAAVAMAALVVAALTVWVTVAARVRADGRGYQRRIGLGALPWELAVAWAAWVAYRRLGDWGVPIGDGADVSEVDVWGLLFPVLFLVAAAALVCRILGLGLRAVRGVSGRWPPVLFLAARRVARSRVALIGLVLAAAIAAGVLGYAASMHRSLDATLEAKAATFVGGDVAVQLARQEPPESVADRATEVVVFDFAWIQRETRESIAVEAIDPATFARAAYWDDTFAPVPLDAVLDRLAEPAEDGIFPAVVVGTDRGGLLDVGIAEGGARHFTVEAIPGVEVFPGMRRPRPTVFVAASVLDGTGLVGTRTEVWIAGDRDTTLAQLDASRLDYDEVRSTSEVADRSSFLTISWTFSFLRFVGIVAGALVLGGAGVHLDARRRDRLLGYAFLRRMGLGRRAHGLALLAELVASIVMGCWTGLAAAQAAAWLAHGRVDPVPTFEPEPLLRLDLGAVAVLGGGAVVVVVVAAALAQRRVDRDDPVEVLRAGV